jgi:hypothetical protein
MVPQASSKDFVNRLSDPGEAPMTNWDYRMDKCRIAAQIKVDTLAQALRERLRRPSAIEVDRRVLLRFGGATVAAWVVIALMSLLIAR